MSKPSIRSFKYPDIKDEMPAGPYAEAGVLVDINAGWRIVRPVIDGKKCVKCQKCWAICPDGAIDRTGNQYEVDYNFCKGCGLCSYECPTKAISMIKEGDKGE
jgi:pyruvate ferredoxin oxidoreductase delta subunit